MYALVDNARSFCSHATQERGTQTDRAESAHTLQDTGAVLTIHEATSNTAGSNTAAHKNKDQQAAIKDLFGSGAGSHTYCASHKTDRGQTIRTKGKAWNIAWCMRIIASNNKPTDWDEQALLRANLMYAPEAVLTTRSAVEDNVKMRLDIPEVKFIRTIYFFCQMVWRAIACRALPEITADAGAQKMGRLFTVREKLFHISKSNPRMWDVTDRVMKGLTVLRAVVAAGFRINSPARITGRKNFDLVVFMNTVAQTLFVCSEEVSIAFALRWSAYQPEGVPIFAFVAGVASRLYSTENDMSGADRATGDIMTRFLQNYKPRAEPVRVVRDIVPAKKRKIDDALEVVQSASGILALGNDIYAAKTASDGKNVIADLAGDLSNEEINNLVAECEQKAVHRIQQLAALKDVRGAVGNRINPEYLTTGGRIDYRYVVIRGSVETVATILYEHNKAIYANSGPLDVLPKVAIEHFITEPRDFKSHAYDSSGKIVGSAVESVPAVIVVGGETPCVAFLIEFIETIGRYTQVCKLRALSC